MFRFKEIKEIKADESRKIKREEKGFMKIKPETNITYEEAKKFVEDLFVAESLS